MGGGGTQAGARLSASVLCMCVCWAGAAVGPARAAGWHGVDWVRSARYFLAASVLLASACSGDWRDVGWLCVGVGVYVSCAGAHGAVGCVQRERCRCVNMQPLPGYIGKQHNPVCMCVYGDTFIAVNACVCMVLMAEGGWLGVSWRGMQA